MIVSVVKEEEFSRGPQVNKEDQWKYYHLPKNLKTVSHVHSRSNTTRNLIDFNDRDMKGARKGNWDENEYTQLQGTRLGRKQTTTKMLTVSVCYLTSSAKVTGRRRILINLKSDVRWRLAYDDAMISVSPTQRSYFANFVHESANHTHIVP
ncbi:hypothetical protein OG21DRAFT_1174321 [Imleria badia]|nr:hypothetical protein OG21DRAFT_1174321 [Imleria badia]